MDVLKMYSRVSGVFQVGGFHICLKGIRPDSSVSISLEMVPEFCVFIYLMICLHYCLLVINLFNLSET